MLLMVRKGGFYILKLISNEYLRMWTMQCKAFKHSVSLIDLNIWAGKLLNKINHIQLI